MSIYYLHYILQILTRKIMNAKYYNFYKEIIEIPEESNKKIYCTLCGNEIVGMRTWLKAENPETLI